MTERSSWLAATQTRAAVLSEAYRLRLNGLERLNLLSVVVPAVLSTLAAIVAALPRADAILIASLPAASVFAGASAVLLTVHKALKCDEYQAECLRLSQAYQSLAVSLEAVSATPEEERSAHVARLANKLEVLAESAKAQLPTRHILRAEKMVEAQRMTGSRVAELRGTVAVGR